MILVDSNVPMYLVGGDHPHKIGSRLALERLISTGERLVTDAEVLQEILHRYSAINRRETIQPAFDTLLGVVDEVLPIDRSIVEAAKGITVSRTKLSARDAIHYAVMQAHGITRILSFDGGFDGLPGIERLQA